MIYTPVAPVVLISWPVPVSGRTKVRMVFPFACDADSLDENDGVVCLTPTEQNNRDGHGETAMRRLVA